MELVKYIDYEGYRYWYEHKLARHRIDICLATTNPDEYCNGYYLYSDKDPSSGKEFVIVKTDNPELTIPLKANDKNHEKLLKEIIDYDYIHLQKHGVSALTAELSEKIKNVLKNG